MIPIVSFIRRLLIGVSVVILPCNLFGQSGGSAFDLDRLTQASKGQSNISTYLTGDQTPTGDVVDPAVYYLGPGDVLAYQTTGLDFSEKMTVVSPENTIMLERTGVFSVRGLTLQRLRDTLTSIMKQRSSNIDVFLSLRRARMVYVTLRGNVTYPGTYAVPASMRVSTFLTVMRQPWLLSKDGGMGEMAKSGNVNAIPTKAQELSRSSATMFGSYAQRNISIRHHQGVSLADLPKAHVEGFSFLDPHVREGDEISVPFEDRFVPTISISGSVVSPATLAYRSGDGVSLLLAAAGGPTDEADLDHIILVQSSGGGKQSIKVDQNFRVVGEDIQLQPGSTIIVERKAETGATTTQGVVQVYGEVLQPGSVIIAPGVTRLSSVVNAVGGATAKASLALSYIVRPDRGSSTMSQQRDDAARSFQYSDLTLEDTLRYNLDQKYRLPYVSCDIAVALADSNSSDNVVLQTGDIIVIQQTPDRVYVYGQVARPGFVPFTPKQRLEWYVDHAGGYAIGAVESRARIIKGRSKVWVEDEADVFVEPGDEIYVPRPPDVPVGTQLQTYAIIANLVTSIAVLTATVYSILRR